MGLREFQKKGWFPKFSAVAGAIAQTSRMKIPSEDLPRGLLSVAHNFFSERLLAWYLRIEARHSGHVSRRMPDFFLFPLESGRIRR